MFVFLWFGATLFFSRCQYRVMANVYSGFKKVRGVTDTQCLGVNRGSLFDGEDHLGRVLPFILKLSRAEPCRIPGLYKKDGVKPQAASCRGNQSGGLGETCC